MAWYVPYVVFVYNNITKCRLTLFHFSWNDRLLFSSIQIRLLFNRKNKTLRAVLATKSVYKLLEENRKTVQALKQSNSVDASNMDTTNNEQGGEDDGEKSIKDIVEEIVNREPWKGQRASKLNLDDFLQLLAEFNQAGIHFS
jgi:18S rRNA (adenine1779-N6/adenine1780-N6)-dimethyltransferase